MGVYNDRLQKLFLGASISPRLLLVHPPLSLEEEKNILMQMQYPRMTQTNASLKKQMPPDR